MNITRGRMEITTNMGCKINCKYCPQSLLLINYYSSRDNIEENRKMSFQTFKTCVDKLPKTTIICFAGMSEPWLNSETTRMLLYALNQGYDTEVYTTLVGMTQEDFDRIKKYKFKEFVLHLPDVDNNSIINVDDNYLKLLKNVILYNEKNRFITSFSCHGQVKKEVLDIINEDVENNTVLNSRAGNVDSEEIAYVDDKKGAITCIRCNNRFDNNILLPDGTVLLCCMDYGMKHPLGNLLHQDLEQIHNSKMANFLRKSLEDDSNDILCRKCENAKSIYEVCDLYQDYYSWALEMYNSKN